MEKSSLLVTRLTRLLGATLMAIWLISVAVVVFFSYEKTHYKDDLNPDYQVSITQLKSPGWQQLVIEPQMNFSWETIKPALYKLPFTLAILLLLTLVQSLLLRYYLAIPWWDLVNIIGTTGPPIREPRLPIKRMDELGYIARAYNDLLDTLNEQHDTLEIKVKQRTLALAKSKQVAEQANRRKSEHLTTISHEIRTPLNGALAAVELLQNTSLSSEQMRLVETARQCSFSLLAIINNILNFSHIESGQMMLSQEKTALLPLLDQAMLTIHSLVLSKPIILSTYVSSDVPLELALDSQRVKQILINLLGNAVKFTQQGNISLNVSCKGKKLCFSVEDTGCGIDQQNQLKIFQPFVRNNNHAQGTGLGLTIAENLARMMGGRLVLFSQLGRGSCFSLILPFHEVAQSSPFHGELCAPQPLHAQLSVWGITCQVTDDHLSYKLPALFTDKELSYLPGRLYSKVKRHLANSNQSGACQQENETTALTNLPLQPWQMNILLVDDAETNRDITGMMLRQLGHLVTLAESGEAALSIGQTQRFDLVLMDIRMPGIDGLLATQCWRDDPMNVDQHCMITALSANICPAEKTRAYQAGINHYLSKPVTLLQLAEILDLTAQFQLQRNVVLCPQTSNPKPLLDLTDQQLNIKLYRTLQASMQKIRESIGNLPALSHQLHTLKGCAGLAGLTALYDAVMQLEIAVAAQEIMTQQDILHLDELIDLLLSPRSTCNSAAIVK